MAARFRAYGWNVLRVEDGNDLVEIDTAIEQARRGTNKPTMIEVKTIIGYGAPKKQGTEAAHGSPLGADEAQEAKATYGWNMIRSKCRMRCAIASRYCEARGTIGGRLGGEAEAVQARVPGSGAEVRGCAAG